MNALPKHAKPEPAPTTPVRRTLNPVVRAAMARDDDLMDVYERLATEQAIAATLGVPHVLPGPYPSLASRSTADELRQRIAGRERQVAELETRGRGGERHPVAWRREIAELRAALAERVAMDEASAAQVVRRAA